MLRAIEQGYVQREIQHSAYMYQRAVEQGRATIVSVNEYVLQEERPMEIMRVDPRVPEAQLQKLVTLRRERDHGRVMAGLDRLREAAQGTTNLVPVILEAVACYTTLGEISDALRDVFGEYHERVTL
jgi:methylmalonyl-CoA mutase N-terminal domain/subunit